MHRDWKVLSLQDIRVLQALRSKHGDDLLEKSITVCSGLDVVSITLCHFVFQEKEITEVSKWRQENKDSNGRNFMKTFQTWKSGLRRLTNNVKINNVCPKTNLEKQ